VPTPPAAAAEIAPPSEPAGHPPVRLSRRRLDRFAPPSVGHVPVQGLDLGAAAATEAHAAVSTASAPVHLPAAVPDTRSMTQHATQSVAAHTPHQPAAHQGFSTGGNGSSAGGGADSDHIYRELLRRLREEQEQLGQIVDEPF
jgi:hypothetical protein